MPEPDERSRRREMRERTGRDLERYRAREPPERFWRSLALIGSVGWPIVLLAVGGALAGRAIDSRLGTGVRFSLLLLAAGTGVGCLVAWRTLGGRRP